MENTPTVGKEPRHRVGVPITMKTHVNNVSYRGQRQVRFPPRCGIHNILLAASVFDEMIQRQVPTPGHRVRTLSDVLTWARHVQKHLAHLCWPTRLPSFPRGLSSLLSLSS